MVIHWLEKFVGETRAALLRLLRRPPQTITGLAEAVGLTDNAVRGHLAALGRDGLVEQVGVERDTGGKPARLYGLTPEGEELFPKAYAPVLGGLLEELVQRHGRAKALDLLEATGRRLAGEPGESGKAAARVAQAAEALRSLGGDVEVRPTREGWHLQGYGCPLSMVTTGHAEACELVRALVEEISGLPAAVACDRTDRPRCAFRVTSARA